MRINCLAFFLLVIAGGSSAYAQAPDAVVVSVKGNALVREAKKTETRPLKKGDKLFAGQRVVCTDGCKELTISYCKVNVPIAVPTRPNGKLIYSINCGALDGVRAGGPKGGLVSITSPKESELIRPETLALRWKPSKSTFILSLRIYLGKTIWGPVKVDGSTGALTPDDSLMAALKKAQKDGEEHFQLILDDGSGTTQRVNFALLSESNRQIVDGKLEAFSDETNRVLKALGRALVFIEYELYGEAVEELEQALATSQASGAERQNLNELRRLTIMANYKAYNEERVRQLCGSPDKSASRLPDICSNLPKSTY